MGSAGESEMIDARSWGWSGLPLLDLVEVLQEGNGDEDNDGLLAVADLDLIARVHVRISVRPKVRAHKSQLQKSMRSVVDVEESLCQ